VHCAVKIYIINVVLFYIAASGAPTKAAHLDPGDFWPLVIAEIKGLKTGSVLVINIG